MVTAKAVAKMKRLAVTLIAFLATTIVSGGEKHKHVASEYGHTAVFGTYLWTAKPADRHQMVHRIFWQDNMECESWDDGYETQTSCPGFSPRRQVDTKQFTYVKLDGGKPLVVDGPKREGTTPCRVVLDGDHQVTEVFVPVFNIKGEITHEVEYKVTQTVD
jgi:hypothetical protein